jgi:hypothetical protein
MQRNLISPRLLLPICLASSAITSHAAPATEGENATPATPGTPAENPPGTTSQGREVAPEAAAETPDLGFKLGADLYYGFSNLASARRFRDGFWIGFGPAFPSVVTRALYRARRLDGEVGAERRAALQRLGLHAQPTRRSVGATTRRKTERHGGQILRAL